MSAWAVRRHLIMRSVVVEPLEIRNFLSVTPLASIDVGSLPISPHPSSGNTQNHQLTITNPTYNADGDATNLGTLVPGQLQAGLQIVCVPGSKAGLANDMVDYYEFIVLEDQTVVLSLHGTMLPAEGGLRLLDDDRLPVQLTSTDGGKTLIGQLKAGDYYLEIGGWRAEHVAEVGYNLDFRTASPAMAVNLQLAGDANSTPAGGSLSLPQIALPSNTGPGSANPAVLVRYGNGTSVGGAVFQIAWSSSDDADSTAELGPAGLSALADKPIGLNEGQVPQPTGNETPRQIDLTGAAAEWIAAESNVSNAKLTPDGLTRTSSQPNGSKSTGSSSAGPAFATPEQPGAGSNSAPARAPANQSRTATPGPTAMNQDPPSAAAAEILKFLDAVYQVLPADNLEYQEGRKTEQCVASSSAPPPSGMAGILVAGLLSVPAVNQNATPSSPQPLLSNARGRDTSGRRAGRRTRIPHFEQTVSDPAT